MKGKKDFNLQKTFSKKIADAPNQDQAQNDSELTLETEEDVRKGLEKLRKVTPIEYTTMKVKKHAHRNLKRIAKREHVNAVDLLNHIIDDWLAKYEQAKS